MKAMNKGNKENQPLYYLIQLNQDLLFIPETKEEPYKERKELEEGTNLLTNKQMAFDLIKNNLATLIEKDVSKERVNKKIT